MKHFLILGSHPKLSQAEALAVLPEQKPLLAGSMALFDTQSWEGLILMERLAGTIKLGDIISESRISNLEAGILADLIEALPRAERVLYGLTIFGGTPAERKRLKHLPIQLKKTLKERGRSSRWVTGDKGELSPAAVSKLKLTSDGYDFCIALAGDKAYVGITTHVQDADAWSKRDYGRPFRDAKTGMLPPKLSRMMLNLAARDTRHATTIYDPFCGAGTILMEAMLMLPNAQVIGSDIDAKQVAGAKRNMEWLAGQGLIAETSIDERLKLFAAPAQETDKHLPLGSVDAIVTEGFLGKPLQGTETKAQLERQMAEVEAVWSKSLPALAKLQRVGGVMVACAPMYKTSHGKAALDLAALASRVGYVDITGDTLVYGRPDQHVARNILIFKRK